MNNVTNTLKEASAEQGGWELGDYIIDAIYKHQNAADNDDPPGMGDLDPDDPDFDAKVDALYELPEYEAQVYEEQMAFKRRLIAYLEANLFV